MSIGVIIKKLRRERDITQDQLAEYLGITSRAVSQWECERTAPDISQLPILANIFNVSADVLLEIDINGKEKRIKEIVDKAVNYYTNYQLEEAVDLLRESLKEYPNSHIIMVNLALVLKILASHNKEKRNDYLLETVTLCEKVLAESTDTIIRNMAIHHLCTAYNFIGENKKALTLANGLPDKYSSKENMLKQILKGTEKYKHIQKEIALDLFYIFEDIANLNFNVFDDGSQAYNLDECIALQYKILDIINILFENNDFGEYNLTLVTIHRNLTFYHIEKKDYESALKHFECAANHAIMFDTIYSNIDESDKEYSSLLFRGMKTTLSKHVSPMNETQELLNIIDNHQLDLLRPFAKYNIIEEKLRNNVKSF